MPDCLRVPMENTPIRRVSEGNEGNE